MTDLNTSIIDVLKKCEFDTTTGKVYRMYVGPDDAGPQEYELPLTDTYLSNPFNPAVEWPDFFGEDAEHFYFPVPALPGERVKVCKTKKSSRQLFPLQAIKARHGDEIIHLQFSKHLTVEVGNVIGKEGEDIGATTVYWREARVAAVGDSVDLAMVRVGINIVNRLVAAHEREEGNSYEIRPDMLISKILHQKGINVAVHCTEAPSEEKEAPQPSVTQQPSSNYTDLTPLLDDPCTDHTLQQKEPVYDPNKDPNFN